MGKQRMEEERQSDMKELWSPPRHVPGRTWKA